MGEDFNRSIAFGQLQNFQQTGQFTDVEIVCRDRTWKAHRVVLALHSYDLAHHCDGPDAPGRRLDLSKFEPRLVECLVKYAYTFDYKTTHTAPDGDIDMDAATIHVGMCKIAAKFGIEELGIAAWSKFYKCLDSWEITGPDFPSEELISLIEAAYEGGYQETHEIREGIIRKMIDTGHLRGVWKVTPLTELMAKYPAFAIDVTTQLARRLDKRKRKRGRGNDGGDARFVYEEEYYCSACEHCFWAYMGPDEEGEFTCPGCGVSEAKGDWLPRRGDIGEYG